MKVWWPLSLMGSRAAARQEYAFVSTLLQPTSHSVFLKRSFVNVRFNQRAALSYLVICFPVETKGKTWNGN